MTQLIHFGTVTPPDWSPAERLDAASLTVLGTYKGTQYARAADGRELRIGRPLMGIEQTNKPARDEVHVVRVTETPDERGKRLPWIRAEEVIRATVCESGTYDRLRAGEQAIAERKATAAIRAQSSHRHDAATYIPALDHQAEQALALGADMPPEVSGASKSARLVTYGGRESVRGIESIVRWLTAKGVQLEVTPGGYLDARARAMDAGTRDVLETFRPLIIGHLSGKPVPCALKHRGDVPAYTMTVSRMPVCREHLDELDGAER